MRKLRQASRMEQPSLNSCVWLFILALITPSFTYSLYKKCSSGLRSVYFDFGRWCLFVSVLLGPLVDATYHITNNFFVLKPSPQRSSKRRGRNDIPQVFWRH